MKKKHVVKVAKKEFPLLFSMGTLEMMEERITGFDLTRIDELIRSSKGLLDVLFCLATEGAIAEGRTLEESREWFGTHAPVSRTWITNAHEAIVAALVDGMSMETDDDEDDDEVDVVLEEIKKKDEKTD